jgi:hypothetical protein
VFSKSSIPDLLLSRSSGAVPNATFGYTVAMISSHLAHSTEATYAAKTSAKFQSA